MSAPESLERPFAFVLCQPGAERALKRELSRALPNASPAYQRPGLVTFKPAAQDVSLCGERAGERSAALLLRTRHRRPAVLAVQEVRLR